MVEKVYVALWGVMLVALGLFFVTGNLNTNAELVFGFLFFGLIFMGMIGVLPHWATHREEQHH